MNVPKLRDSGNPICDRFANVLFANFDLLELLHSQSFPAFLTATNNFVANWTSLILICDPPVVTIPFSFKGNNHQSTNHFSGLMSPIRGLPESTTVDFILMVKIRSYQSLSLAYMYYWQAVKYSLILWRSSSLAATHSLPSTLQKGDCARPQATWSVWESRESDHKECRWRCIRKPNSIRELEHKSI